MISLLLTDLTGANSFVQSFLPHFINSFINFLKPINLKVETNHY